MPSRTVPNQEPTAPTLLSLRETARRLHATTYMVQKLTAMGRLTPVVEMGVTPRYRSDDVARLARERGATAQAAG